MTKAERAVVLRYRVAVNNLKEATTTLKHIRLNPLVHADPGEKSEALLMVKHAKQLLKGADAQLTILLDAPTVEVHPVLVPDIA